MKIKEQTRKIAQAAQNSVLRLQIGLTWFEEIFEEWFEEIFEEYEDYFF
ncbi:hypothetical protein [Streptococcus pneumoniae]|nr:hypothetical protein [Streptococcus pneumoniae]